eukprot:scaffold1027_cov116-Isochrysis_galbana.AAC.2
MSGVRGLLAAPVEMLCCAHARTPPASRAGLWVSVRECVRAVAHDKFSDHRVIKHRHVVPLHKSRVDPRCRPRGRCANRRRCDRLARVRRGVQVKQGARGGEEVGGRALGVDAGFDGVSAEGQLGLAQGEGLASCHPELPLD